MASSCRLTGFSRTETVDMGGSSKIYSRKLGSLGRYWCVRGGRGGGRGASKHETEAGLSVPAARRQAGKQAGSHQDPRW